MAVLLRLPRTAKARALRASIVTAGVALCVTIAEEGAAAPAPMDRPSMVIAVAPPTADDKSWYEKGPWPIVGGVAALVVTNAVAVGVVYLQASRGFNAVLRQRRIEALSASLSEFYNPLLALLDINGEVFDKTGPPSFPDGEIERGGAALVWAETKKVILENNRRILEILRTRTHRLYARDSLGAYNDLMIHVAMYETFQTIPTDRYRGFFFPKNVRQHIADMRDLVLADFNALTGSQL